MTISRKDDFQFVKKKDSNYGEEFQIWGLGGNRNHVDQMFRGRCCDDNIFRGSLRGWGEGLKVEVSTLKIIPRTETFGENFKI